MTGPRILVVDDEPIVCLHIRHALERQGYVVAGCASAGAEAVDQALCLLPDLVLMDICLPGGMDGAAAALEIGRQADIPVVFLTAHSDEDTMRRALAASPFGYIIKPFEDRELRGPIELALAKHRAEQELKSARRAAEEADRAKTAFLGALSHELRTPLNGILGLAEVLSCTALDEEQRQLVEELQNCAKGFTVVLNQLLEYSSLEAGYCLLVDEDFEPATLLARVVEGHRARAKARGIALVLEHGPLPPLLRGAASRVRQVLEHLLDNAITFTTNGSVRLEAAMEGGELAGMRQLVLRVRDTGCGIAPERLAKMFESFTQGEELLTRNQKGLGLGLTICQKVAHCMGGRIEVQSEPGTGSVFTFSVPLRRCEAAPTAITRTTGRQGADA